MVVTALASHQTRCDVILYIERSREIQVSTLTEFLGGILNNMLYPFCTISDISRDYTETRRNLRNVVDAEEERLFRLSSDGLEDELHRLTLSRRRSDD